MIFIPLVSSFVLVSHGNSLPNGLLTFVVELAHMALQTVNPKGSYKTECIEFFGLHMDGLIADMCSYASFQTVFYTYYKLPRI